MEVQEVSDHNLHPFSVTPFLTVTPFFTIFTRPHILDTQPHHITVQQPYGHTLSTHLQYGLSWYLSHLNSTTSVSVATLAAQS